MLHIFQQPINIQKLRWYPTLKSKAYYRSVWRTPSNSLLNGLQCWIGKPDVGLKERYLTPAIKPRRDWLVVTAMNYCWKRNEKYVICSGTKNHSVMNHILPLVAISTSMYSVGQKRIAAKKQHAVVTGWAIQRKKISYRKVVSAIPRWRIPPSTKQEKEKYLKQWKCRLWSKCYNTDSLPKLKINHCKDHATVHAANIKTVRNGDKALFKAWMMEISFLKSRNNNKPWLELV